MTQMTCGLAHMQTNVYVIIAVFIRTFTNVFEDLRLPQITQIGWSWKYVCDRCTFIGLLFFSDPI